MFFMGVCVSIAWMIASHAYFVASTLLVYSMVAGCCGWPGILLAVAMWPLHRLVWSSLAPMPATLGFTQSDDV